MIFVFSLFCVGFSLKQPVVHEVQGFGPEPVVYDSSTMYWTPRELTIDRGDSVKYVGLPGEPTR
jgi:hypothetical protein